LAFGTKAAGQTPKAEAKKEETTSEVEDEAPPSGMYLHVIPAGAVDCD
jgi:hypothetical protein